MHSYSRNTLIILSIFVAALGCLSFTFPLQDGNRHGGGMGHGGGPMTAAGLTTFVTEDFDGSGQCAFCHADLRDEANNDVSNDANWRSTMMANAARDPYWQAKVSAEVKEAPAALASVIEDTCAKCHMPMARTQATVNGDATRIFGNSGFTSDKNNLHEAAMDGVSCTLCHQIDPANIGADDSFSGGYAVDTSTSAPQRPIYGPYTNPVTNPMLNLGGYLAEYGEHMSESAMCATCHTLYTPTLDGNGEIVGSFPEQTAFLEWKESRYPKKGTTCQECHMPKAKGAVQIARIGSSRKFEPFFQHYFVGGNVFMLRLLRDNIDDLDLTADETHFDATIERTLEQLQKRVTKIKVKSAKRQGDTLTAVVKIKNKAGHKFPTGFPSRRAWIELTVTDGEGATVFSSGAPEDEGKIAGNDNDEDPSTFEPHYDIIDKEDEVQIYEGIVEDTDGRVTRVLLRGSGYAKDNRMLPKGYKKGKTAQDVAVYGRADEDGNFKGGADLVTYEIDLDGATGPFTVTAKLHYQSVAFPFIDFFNDVKTTEGKAFLKLVKKTGNEAVLVDDHSKTVN